MVRQRCALCFKFVPQPKAGAAASSTCRPVPPNTAHDPPRLELPPESAAAAALNRAREVGEGYVATAAEVNTPVLCKGGGRKCLKTVEDEIEVIAARAATRSLQYVPAQVQPRAARLSENDVLRDGALNAGVPMDAVLNGYTTGRMSLKAESRDGAKTPSFGDGQRRAAPGEPAAAAAAAPSAADVADGEAAVTTPKTAKKSTPAQLLDDRAGLHSRTRYNLLAAHEQEYFRSVRAKDYHRVTRRLKTLERREDRVDAAAEDVTAREAAVAEREGARAAARAHRRAHLAHRAAARAPVPVRHQPERVWPSRAQRSSTS